MRTARLLCSAGLAALLLACQTSSNTGAIDQLPSNNPTATSTDLATGG